MEPAEYDAWYGTARGSWIEEVEYRLLYRLLAPPPGARVIGTSRSRRALRSRRRARALPFSDQEFDYCVSVTALCFIPDELAALAEMFRVTRRRIAIGLLNRRSILCFQKGRRGGTGALRGQRLI